MTKAITGINFTAFDAALCASLPSDSMVSGASGTSGVTGGATGGALIDGRAIANAQLDELSARVKTIMAASPSNPPTLAVILVGDDPASKVYVGNKIRTCAKVGIISKEFKLPATATKEDVVAVIQSLNTDPSVHGILLQLPLPKHLDGDALVQLIAPTKDVDGLNIVNVGKLVAGDQSGFVPCTPMGSLRLIHSVQPHLSGMHAVVIGRSLLFGKPMAQLLLRENCTVTMAHSRTRDLPALCRHADILIAAVGQPQMVKVDWVKPDAIVIDVGINRLDNGSLVGDVDFEAVRPLTRAITPVPGGVGPMTIAGLMANTLKAYEDLG